MARPPFLFLHKTEWERLKQQSGPPPEEPINLQNEYLKALTEKSQEWIKTWPDTVSGHVAQIEKQKKDQHRADIAFVKAYVSKKKKDNTAEAIKEARQLIFEDSSYGKKLLSAQLESRALEVRDAQIKFQKEVKQKEAELAKEQESKNAPVHNYHANDEEREKIDKIKALECNRINKEMVSMKKEKEQQTKLKEEQCAIETEKLMKQVIVIEEKQKNDIKRCKKQALEEYEAETKELVKLREREKKLDEELTELYKKRQDSVILKMKAVLKKTHQGRPDTKWSKDLYKNLDRLQSDERKCFEDFVVKGIKKLEERNSQKETKDKLQEKQNSSSRYLTSQLNKIAGEEERLAKKHINKCYCDRQNLIMKTTGKPFKKTEMPNEIKTNDRPKAVNSEIKIGNKPSKGTKCDGRHDQKKKLPFLEPRNKLVEALKKREMEPSPWNGAKGVHAQFAQQADDVLKEIKHKHFARKVVDEYRRFNCLDATTLPVPNY